MYLGDPNITKKGLLCLKDSKPVPITAHSGECIIPCIYTETVKKVLKAKGIELPLTPAKLAEARKLAKTIPGHYKHDPSEKPGGSSHAKGTTNVTVNIKNVLPTVAKNRRRGRQVGKGRSKIIMARASGLIPAPPSIHPKMAVNPNYNLIRPFVANTPIGYEPLPIPSREQMKKDLEKDAAMEKRMAVLDRLHDQIQKREQEEQRYIQSQMVPPDAYVDKGREDVVHSAIRSSGVKVEELRPRPLIAPPDEALPSNYDQMSEQQQREFIIAYWREHNPKMLPMRYRKVVVEED